MFKVLHTLETILFDSHSTVDPGETASLGGVDNGFGGHRHPIEAESLTPRVGCRPSWKKVIFRR